MALGRGRGQGEGVAAGPLNLRGRSEGRSRGRRHAGWTVRGGRRALRGGAYWPLPPRTLRGSPGKARAPGPGNRLPRAPGAHAGGGRAGLPARARASAGRSGRGVAGVWPPFYGAWTRTGLAWGLAP